MQKIGKISLAITSSLFFSFSTAQAANVEYLCQNPNYTCIRAVSGDTWENLFPEHATRNYVKKLNGYYHQPYNGMVIAYPSNIDGTNNNEGDVVFTSSDDNYYYQNQRYSDNRFYGYESSPFSAHISFIGQKTIVVDPNIPAWAAYDSSGQLVRWGAASAGKNYCPDIHRPCRTISGVFSIYRKGGPDAISSKFPIETRGGAPIPYAMHFHGGFALHGSYDVPGYNASHGCVRMHVEDARWLNQNFAEIGTKVIVRPYGNRG